MELDPNSMVSNRLSLSLSCFFCLRSNSRKYLNPQEGESNSYGDGEDDVSSFQEFSLRNLYRFLNLLHSDKEEKDFRDLKMPICEDCFRLNDEFNKLFNLLEETKLRLNWCVKKMQDVITNSKNKSRLPTATQVEIIEEEEDVDEEKVLDIWRTHTMDRMKEVTRTSFPRVLVHKKSRKRSQFALNDCPESVGQVEATAKRLRTQDEKDKCSALNEEMLAPQEALIRSQSLPSSSSLVDQRLIEDNACNNIHDNGDVDVIATEMDSDGKISKECSVAQQLIKRKSHLRSERTGKPASISNIIPVSNNIRMRAQFRCKACKAMINRMKAFEHWEHECPKGPQRPLLSTVTKPSARSRGAPRIKCSSKFSNCPHCSFKSSASASFSMERHIVHFHPEHYLIDEKDKEMGLWHERFRSILSYMVYPHFIVIAGSHRSCTSCGTTYKCNMANENIIMIKRHLIFHHKTELKEKLKDVLQDPSLEEKLDRSCNLKKGISKPRVTKNYSRHGNKFLRKRTATRTFFKTPGKKFSTNCSYCPYTTSRNNSTSGTMIAHLVRFHPEHFLIDEEDKKSGLWHEHFRTILKGMVYPSFISTVEHNRNHRSCSACGIVYKSGRAIGNVVMMQRHLIFNHKRELKEKFKIILDDPLFEEKLLGSRNLKKKMEVMVIRKEKTKKKKVKKEEESRSLKARMKTKLSKIGDKQSTSCSYCSFKTNSHAGGSMVGHLVRFHPEHYLIDDDDRATGLWHEQFPTILTNLVYPNFISKTGHHRSCSLCGVLYKCGKASMNAIMAKRHLIFNHKEELKEKFKNILEDPTLQQKLHDSNSKLKKDKERTPAPIRWSNCTTGENVSSHCPYCRFKCCASANAWKESIVKHLVQFHPQHFLIDESEMDQVPKQFHTILTDVVLPKFVRKTGKNTSCVPCGMQYQSICSHQNGVSVRRHLIFNHKALLKDEIRNNLEQRNDQNQSVPSTSTSRDLQERKHSYASKCPYCRYECDSPDILPLSMENHFVRFHPEHFLLEEEGKSISRHPEFQRILSDMIFPKFLLRTGQQTQCSLCKMKHTVGKRHENVVLLKKHLLLRHCAELREHIEGVMEDPTLEEKLDSCSADGVTCSCGVYFAPLEQQARRFHENFHCIHVRNAGQSQEEKVQCSPHANNEMDRKQMEVDEKRSSGIFGLGEVDLLELD